MASPSSLLSVMATIAIAAAILMVGAEAQSPTTQTCAAQLVPCASYVNATNPPASCCNPIKDAVRTQLPCLCNLYNTPGLLESFGISVAQALNLTQRCGVPANTSTCSSVNAPPPSTSTTQPVSGGNTNFADRITWSGIWTLFLISALAMLH